MSKDYSERRLLNFNNYSIVEVCHERYTGHKEHYCKRNVGQFHNICLTTRKVYASVQVS